MGTDEAEIHIRLYQNEKIQDGRYIVIQKVYILLSSPSDE